MQRREFIALLGGAAAVWPRVARAQQREKPARLGYVWIGARNSERSTLVGMREGLQQLGYSEGRDFVIEERYAELEPERLPDILTELIRSRVDLILSPGNAVTQAAMQATSSIPIIATAPDLLASGFVSNLARPGGNVTGISLTAGAELSQKWLELLKEAFPKVASVAVLTNLHLASAAYLDRIRVASSALGVQATHFQARDQEELERALVAIAAMQPDGFIVESDPGLISSRLKIIAFAARHRPRRAGRDSSTSRLHSRMVAICARCATPRPTSPGCRRRKPPCRNGRPLSRR